MHPVRFVKEHPVGTVVCGLVGMSVGPMVLNQVRNWTGVGIRVPRVGS
jgi:hypothetical protein